MRNRRQEGNDGARGSATLTKRRRDIGLLCVMLAVAMVSPAQDGQPEASKVKFKVLVDVNGSYSGYGASSGLVQGIDGNLYGTNFGGTVNSICGGTCGLVYKMTPAGALTTIYNFCSLPNCADGIGPNPGPVPLALGADGNFYGTAAAGGASVGSCPQNPVGGCGTVFKLTPGGTLTTLYNFCSQPNCTDSGFVFSGVVLGPDGNFYGTTASGGAHSNSMCIYSGCGTIYKITPEGGFTTLYNFCSQPNCSDGASPYPGLAVGAGGDLYGIANAGGTSNLGTIFKLTLGGTLTTLHSFGGTDGGCYAFYCLQALVQAHDGNFYGVAGGGTDSGGGGLGGVLFRISPGGTYTVLYNFCSLAGCSDGEYPFALAYGNDGNFYGAAAQGGSKAACGSGCGTLFKVTPEGILTTVHTFNGTTDGSDPQTLVQATNGIFYGAAQIGGTYNEGTIYALTTGLSQFVETVPTSGKVGTAVQILGNKLTGATAVSFNGTAAAFTVQSNTLITATVPAGATTGHVTVTTPSGTLQSNVKFRVHP